MRIKTYLWQNRRDFNAVYECEHCGTCKKGSGYDDANFHEKVIPKMKCEACGEVAASTYKANTTRYPDHVTV